MPPTGYLTTTSIEACLQYIANKYSGISQLITLPETSVQGRTSRAIKLGKGGGANRRGVLFIGGLHARELINPDALVTLALKLCQAYATNSDLTFGNKTYSAGVIKLIIEGMDLFIFPLVNPDGREHVQSPTGYAMWRKNRRINPNTTCIGVDLNRNFDFLWQFTIGQTSSNPCSDTYKGASAFSEPETRNVRYLLDTYKNICCYMDVHSYSQLVLYPWGDDDNQTTDPSMNFMNPAYNGLRGTLGDSRYREYIPPSDLNWYVSTGGVVRDAIAAVRGRTYTVQQSPDLYPTSGTSDDYVYSRGFVNTSVRKVRGFTLETGLEFQPAFPEAFNVMQESASGLIQFCLSCLCALEQVVRGTDLVERLEDWRTVRDGVLAKTATGRRYVDLLERHQAELIELMATDDKLRTQVVGVLRRVDAVVRTRNDAKPKGFDAQLVIAADRLAQAFNQRASKGLQESIAVVRKDQRRFIGKSLADAIKGSLRPDKKTK
jgi:murein tripeptide amidase MpaA